MPPKFLSSNIAKATRDAPARQKTTMHGANYATNARKRARQQQQQQQQQHQLQPEAVTVAPAAVTLERITAAELLALGASERFSTRTRKALEAEAPTLKKKKAVNLRVSLAGAVGGRNGQLTRFFCRWRRSAWPVRGRPTRSSARATWRSPVGAPSSNVPIPRSERANALLRCAPRLRARAFATVCCTCPSASLPAPPPASRSTSRDLLPRAVLSLVRRRRPPPSTRVFPPGPPFSERRLWLSYTRSSA